MGKHYQFIVNVSLPFFIVEKSGMVERVAYLDHKSRKLYTHLLGTVSLNKCSQSVCVGLPPNWLNYKEKKVTK